MLTVLFFKFNCIEEIISWYIFVVNKLKCLNHCHNIIKSSKMGLLSWTIAENMRKIVQKNEVSIMKLSSRRGLECRILHHLSQSFWGPQTPGCKGHRACHPHQFAFYFSIFSCYFKIYWHPWWHVDVNKALSACDCVGTGSFRPGSCLPPPTTRIVSPRVVFAPIPIRPGSFRPHLLIVL